MAKYIHYSNPRIKLLNSKKKNKMAEFGDDRDQSALNNWYDDFKLELAGETPLIPDPLFSWSQVDDFNDSDRVFIPPNPDDPTPFIPPNPNVPITLEPIPFESSQPSLSESNPSIIPPNSLSNYESSRPLRRGSRRIRPPSPVLTMDQVMNRRIDAGELRGDVSYPRVGRALNWPAEFDDDGLHVDVELRRYDERDLKARFLQLKRGRINSFKFHVRDVQYDLKRLNRLMGRGNRFIFKSAGKYIVLNYANRKRILEQLDQTLVSEYLQMGNDSNTPGSNQVIISLKF